MLVKSFVATKEELFGPPPEDQYSLLGYNRVMVQVGPIVDLAKKEILATGTLTDKVRMQVVRERDFNLHPRLAKFVTLDPKTAEAMQQGNQQFCAYFDQIEQALNLPQLAY